jgi:hypothetical protein
MKDPIQSMDEPVKYVLDGASIVTALATLTAALPAIAALFSIIWTSLRIYETKTVQGWVNKAVSVAKEDNAQ